MTDSENAIEVRNVSKTFRIYHEKRTTLYEHFVAFANRKRNYEQLKVLDNISFDVKKGEMIGIIGRNGEGKSTLLKILSRIYKPDSGSVKVSGSVTPLLEIGSGFQMELTAVENIAFYGILLGFSKKEIKSKIPDILSYAELEKFADTKLKNFSSGMYARLAFSTAMQVNPDVLLVDEVLAVGDVPFQEKSFRTFMDFKKRGKTIVFVTHNLSQVQRLCDKAIFLDKGRIRNIGEPNTVINEFYKVVEGIDLAKMHSSNLQNTTKTSNIRRTSPTCIAINNNCNLVYVCNSSSDDVAIIDGSNNQLLGSIRVGSVARDIAVNDRTNRVYVANRDSNSVSVIDGETNRVIEIIKVGDRPRGIAVNDRTNRVYVANRDSNSVSVIDGETNRVMDTIPVHEPQGIAVNDRTNRVYVANSNSSSISVIDGETNRVIEIIKVGNTPIGIAVNDRTNRVYVANRDSNSVSVIDGETNRVMDTIPAENGPFYISIDNERDLVFVTCSGANLLVEFDSVTKSVRKIAVGNYPIGIAIDPKSRKLYVANQAEDTISILDENYCLLSKVLIQHSFADLALDVKA